MHQAVNLAHSPDKESEIKCWTIGALRAVGSAVLSDISKSAMCDHLGPIRINGDFRQALKGCHVTASSASLL